MVAIINESNQVAKNVRFKVREVGEGSKEGGNRGEKASVQYAVTGCLGEVSTGYCTLSMTYVLCFTPVMYEINTWCTVLPQPSMCSSLLSCTGGVDDSTHQPSSAASSPAGGPG